MKNGHPLVQALHSDLARLQQRFRGSPEKELHCLLLLALEREEIVAIGYREAMIERRLKKMPVAESLKNLIRQSMVWIWQDEAMHVVYIRGVIRKLRQRSVAMRAFIREAQGILGGWSGSMQQHVTFREAPVARSLSSITAAAGMVAGAVPREVRQYLRYRPFRDYCHFNVAAESTAALVYQRMIELAQGRFGMDSPDLTSLRKVLDDEERHGRVFRLFADALTEGDQLASTWTEEALKAELLGVSPFLVPLSGRSDPLSRGNRLGRGGTVVVRQGRPESKPHELVDEVLSAVRLPEIIEEQCTAHGCSASSLAVAIKPTFMMLYSHRDPSPAVNPDVLHGVVRFLTRHGIRRISVIETAKVYEDYFRNRAVEYIAKEFGYCSDEHVIHDGDTEHAPHSFRRGLGESSISTRWRDAGLRINLGKLRSHPIERVLLTIPNLEGLGRRWSDFVFADREATYATAILMIHDEAPAHLSILDAFKDCPDGPLGVMGSRQAKSPGRVYAARDGLALDFMAARHMGLKNPMESPILQSACYWFGDPRPGTVVDGVDEEIPGWHGPCHNDLTALFSLAAQFSYQWCSGRGALFVPQMDPALFPPVAPPGFALRAGRALIQRIFGLNLR